MFEFHVFEKTNVLRDIFENIKVRKIKKFYLIG